MEKLDITGNFDVNTLLAKLLTIIRAYERQKSELLEDRNKFDSFIENLMNEKFVYPADKREILLIQLELFCLGSKSIFDKYTKL